MLAILVSLALLLYVVEPRRTQHQHLSLNEPTEADNFVDTLASFLLSFTPIALRPDTPGQYMTTGHHIASVSVDLRTRNDRFPSFLMVGAIEDNINMRMKAARMGDPTTVMSSDNFLDQRKAIQVDEDLMSNDGGFSIDQLMELAGLSVASAIAKEYPPDTHPQVLIICGPGNNGGDGLVVARHLYHFGYRPKLIYPKMQTVISKNELYRRLTVQLEQLGIVIEDEWRRPHNNDVDVLVDAVFGFSFKGWRGGGKDAPFDEIVEFMATQIGEEASFTAPLVSIDIPSGWDVETGPIGDKALRPEMLVSLTAPKKCAASFEGKFHYLGGRFVPPGIIAKNNLVLPVYPGAEQVVKLAAI